MGPIEIFVLLIVAFVSASVSGVLGSMIGLVNGRTEGGFWLGFFLGPIGWVITYLLDDSRLHCPDCLGVVIEGARKCRNCGTMLPPKPIVQKQAASGQVEPLPPMFGLWIAIIFLVFLAAVVVISEGETEKSSANGGTGSQSESSPVNNNREYSIQKGPVVEIVTSHGNIEVELFEKDSPQTVKNFLEYVDTKHYDGLIFHRITNDLIQGGGLNRDLTLINAGSTIQNESVIGGLKNLRGTISMARYDHPHSASNQFFINRSDNEHYDTEAGKYGYCVFGRVIDGMSVVDLIGQLPRRDYRDIEGLTFERVAILTIRRK
jgi:cyclophilin family peptidyl-prolyl cis-trans isomerase